MINPEPRRRNQNSSQNDHPFSNGTATQTATLAVAPRPTWESLLLAEPRLIPIARRASAAAIRFGRSRPMAFWHCYESLKREASRYAGWHAKRPELGTSQAYEVVLSELVAIMSSGRSRRGASRQQFPFTPRNGKAGS